MFKHIAVISLAVLIVASIGCLFLGSHFFKIEQVELSDLEIIDKDSLLQYKGKNLFFVYLTPLKKEIEKLPEVKYAVIKKELPDKLIIDIYKYQPCAFFNENKETALSKEGIVFPYKNSMKEGLGTELASYPSVVYNGGELVVGRHYAFLEKAMDVYWQVKNIIPISIIELKKNGEISLYAKDTNAEIRMGKGEFVEKIDYLKLLVNKKPSVKNAKYVDLRFGRDIVVKP